MRTLHPGLESRLQPVERDKFERERQIVGSCRLKPGLQTFEDKDEHDFEL